MYLNAIFIFLRGGFTERMRGEWLSTEYLPSQVMVPMLVTGRRESIKLVRGQNSARTHLVGIIPAVDTVYTPHNHSPATQDNNKERHLTTWRLQEVESSVLSRANYFANHVVKQEEPSTPSVWITNTQCWDKLMLKTSLDSNKNILTREQVVVRLAAFSLTLIIGNRALTM